MKRHSLLIGTGLILLCVGFSVVAGTKNPAKDPAKRKTLNRQEIINSLQKMVKGEEEIVFNTALEDMATLLSAGNDKELCAEFFKLILSRGNNALDGEFGEAVPPFLAEIFWNNSDFVSETIKQYANRPLPKDSLWYSVWNVKTEEQLLYTVLEAGWKDFLHGKNPNDPKIIELTKRLKALQSGR